MPPPPPYVDLFSRWLPENGLCTVCSNAVTPVYLFAAVITRNRLTLPSLSLVSVLAKRAVYAIAVAIN